MVDTIGASNFGLDNVVTHGGTVRARTESIEWLQDRQNGSGGSAGAARAIENTYSFV